MKMFSSQRGKMLSKKRAVLFITVGVSIGSIAYAITPRHPAKQEPEEQRAIITTVPQIISCAKNLKVVKSQIKGPLLLVEVENTGEVGVIGVAMTTAKDRAAYTVTLSGSFKGTGDHLIVIKPHERNVLNMDVSNIFPGVPLQIDGAMYADGTEEGCDLVTLHQIRDRESKNNKEKPD
ncbi:MAG: hypothetical protein JWM21_2642 [Acidobacteria bacterium]|nr:hypothetical protein [Acidobacteriota bacterium]